MTIAPSPARNEAIRILAEHESVHDAWLVEETGADGRKYSIAYIIPNPAYMAAAMTEAYQASRDRNVGQWRMTFDQNYRAQDDDAPSFVGWNSSYAKAAIPETEMEDWLNRTVARIAALRPKRVLEIGCGVGLLVRALAPACDSYLGTDISQIALDRLRAFVTARADLSHVALLERQATELDDQPAQSVDTVIINSVAQYFPHLDYLHTVLERAARLVAPGGRIFLGDLRHLGLLRVFHNSAQLAKAAPETDVASLKRRIFLAIEHERELVIDPGFFHALSRSIPRIAGAEMLLKRSAINNELTRYRYDVVLHVGEARPQPAPAVPAWDIGSLSIGEVMVRFEAEGLPAIRILDLANRRVARDLAATEALAAADDRRTAGEVQAGLIADVGHDPEDFWRQGDAAQYETLVSWSPAATDGSFDAVLVDRRQWSGPMPQPRPSNKTGPSQVSTDPLAAAFKQRCGAALMKVLRDRLAPELRPATVLVVSERP
jgi:SAM-dependent methyltransferase